MLALRLRRGDGVTTKAGDIIRPGSWPRDVVDLMVRTGALEYVTVSPDGTATPAEYRATRPLRDGPRRFARGDVVPGAARWPAFLALLGQGALTPADAPQTAQNAPQSANAALPLPRVPPTHDPGQNRRRR